jgi:hypothetical protein
VALRWEATGPTGVLFPVLDADLTLTPAQRSSTTPDSPPGTRLRLLYSYRPPLGRLRAAIDTAVLSRVATATIRSLLDDLAGLLADTTPKQPVIPYSPQLQVPPEIPQSHIGAIPDLDDRSGQTTVSDGR